jgi:uncharacterized protein (TIGR02996 family)
VLEEEGFLRSIIDSPEDDTPRLVYADWLEERGDPHGEFIRVQCALKRPHAAEDHDRLAAREKELLQAHDATWAKPIRRLVEKWAFTRGFVEAVCMTPRQFLRHAATLLRRAPVQWVELRADGIAEESRSLARRLADCPHLSRIPELTFRDSWGEESLRIVLTSPHLAGATFLEFGDYNCTAVTAEILASTPALSRLRTLCFANFDGAPMGDAGVSALAQASHLAGLENLVLENCRVEHAGAAALAHSPSLTRLAHLNLGGGYYTTNRIGWRGAAALAGSPNLGPVTFLQLDYNSIGDRGLRALAESPHTSRMKQLYLGGNRIGDAGLAALAATSHFDQLACLVLSGNNIGNAGLTALARSPLLGRLKTLWLAQNRIGAPGTSALASSPLASHLEELSLQECNIGRAGVEALAASPHLDGLTRLCVGFARFGESLEKLLRRRFGDRLVL